MTIKYNIFKDAYSIKNVNTCLYDTTSGYISDFSINGDVSGWDIYNNICLYGSWDGILFGTALDNTCYIGRTNPIVSLSAEHYYMFKLTMKLTVPDYVKHKPTKFRIMWQTTSDVSWSVKKSIDINLNLSNKWYTYIVTLGESSYWIGDIFNIRVYPFIDGRADTQFAIKHIEIFSNNVYKCINTNCSHYEFFKHPCPYIGDRSSVTASIGLDRYSLISEESDTLLVNIDGYGDEQFKLGTINLSGYEFSKFLQGHINRVSVGQYAYAEVEYSEETKKLSIISGASAPIVAYNPSGRLNDEVLVFDNVGSYNYTIPNYVKSVDLLIIAGGGGGGNNVGGAGGAGGYIEINNYTGLKCGDVLSIVVGAGGLGASVPNGYRYNGANGQNSSVNTWVVVGGGGGSSSGQGPVTAYGIVGGSGGGGGVYYPGYKGDGGKGVEGQGNNGSSVFNNTGSSVWVSGGGGGAGGSAPDITITSAVHKGGSGGVGRVSSITGTSIVRATGGTGWTYGTTSVVVHAQSGTGDGGGGNGGNGGSGIVIIRVNYDFTNYSNIKVGGSAATALGFFDNHGCDISTYKQGKSAATGFEYYSSYRFTGLELNSLIDSKTDRIAYTHNPKQYTVEAGRRDYAESMSSNHAPNSLDLDYYKVLVGDNKLIIDASHPVNDCGRLTTIIVNGKLCEGGSKVILIRPLKNSIAKVITSINIPVLKETDNGTAESTTSSVEVNWEVLKGDMIGFYNFSVLCPFSLQQQAPNAVYFEVNGLPSGEFFLGSPKAQGVVGFSFYARSNRLQRNVALEIDLGKRLNTSKLCIKGVEKATNFEYNIAACLDVSWAVELFNETHWHIAIHTNPNVPSVRVVHRNQAYGVDCLSDCVRSAENGIAGESTTTQFMGSINKSEGGINVSDGDPDTYSGFKTFGKHSYCYVNGDAEWLAKEFVYPWGGSLPYDYEYDPIAYLLIFPYKRKLKVHKTGMYFKDSHNFKELSLNYYIREDGAGNSSLPNFSYVQSFNAVIVDGITYLPTMKDIEDLLGQQYIKVYFSNPWPSCKLNFVNNSATNSDIYLTIMKKGMNVIEHEFDAVECYGFAFQTTFHKSTKLTELEVYSSMEMEPSLVDNVIVSVSTYGDYWTDLVFEDVDTDVIKASLVGAPRYFKIDLSSQDIFFLYEMWAEISAEQLKSLGCETSLTTVDAKRGDWLPPKALEIENQYDRSLDLYINLLHNANLNKSILCWLKCNSLETTLNAEVGPGGILRKEEDYPLFLASGQVANNTQSYYLQNLIHGAKAYHQINGGEWKFYKFLAAGEDINYSNQPNVKSYTIKFDPISSKYWKIGVKDLKRHNIYSIKAFNQYSIPIEVQNVYIQTTKDHYSGKYITKLDDYGVIQPLIVLDKLFSNSDVITEGWLSNNGSENTLFSYITGLQPFLSPFGEVFLEKEFLPGVISFDLEITFKFKFPNELGFKIEFLNAANEILLVCEFIGYINATCKVHVYTYIKPSQEVMAASNNELDYWVFNIPVLSNTNFSEFKLVLKKVGNEFKNINLTTLDGLNTILTSTNKLTFPDRFSKIRFRYNNYGDRLYNNVYDLVSIYSIKLTSPVVLSNVENIVIDFKGSQVLSAIEITKDVVELSYPVVYISYDDNNNYISWARTFIQSESIIDKHSNITASYICYTVSYAASGQGSRIYPWSCVNSTLADSIGVNSVNLSSVYDFWYCYDCGKGNECCVRSIFISFDNMIQYTNDYISGRIYGTNTNFIKFNPNSSVNILLAEFDIVYTHQSPYSNTITFNNTNFFRFLVVYVPAIDNTAHRINIRHFKVYESYVVENNDANFLLFKEEFNGSNGVNPDIWGTAVSGYCKVITTSRLNLVNYSGDIYSSQVCYLKEPFILNNSAKYTITCKWLPSESSIYNTSEGPYIGIRSLNSSRTDATTSTLFIKILLSQSNPSATDNQRTAIRVSYQGSSASTIGTVIGTMPIDINESIWHNLKVMLDFESCTVTVTLDDIFTLNVIVPRTIISAIGYSWQLEFGNRGYGSSKTNAERFGDVCVYSNFVHPNMVTQELPVKIEKDYLVYTIPAGTVETDLINYTINISVLKSFYDILKAKYYNTVLEVGAGKQFSSVLAAVNVAPIGAAIFIHPGTYYESSTITITKQVHLIGYTSKHSDVVLINNGPYSGNGGVLHIDISDTKYISQPKIVIACLTLYHVQAWHSCISSYGGLFDREIYNCYLQATGDQYPLVVTGSRTVLYNCKIDNGYAEVFNFTSGYLAFFKCRMTSPISYYQSSMQATTTDIVTSDTNGYGPFFYEAYNILHTSNSVWDSSYRELETYYNYNETEVSLDIILPYVYKDKDTVFIIRQDFISNKIFYSEILSGNAIHYSVIVQEAGEEPSTFITKYNQNLSIKESLYYNYLAIDLGQHHNIEFIRQYGDRANLINLFTSSTIDFSSSNISDIKLVNWTENKPVLLLHLNTFTDSSIYNNTIVVVDSVTIKNTDSAVTPNGHVVFTGGYLKVINSPLFNLFNNLFTLEFRIKRNKLGEEGVIYKGSQLAVASTFEVNIDASNFLCCTFYVGAVPYTIKSSQLLLTGVWYHIAIMRTKTTLSLYIDGKLQNGEEFAETTSFNTTNYDIIIGRTVWLSSTIELDELRFINGYTVWFYNFTVPTAQYTVDTVGDKSFARWLKIPFLCGDGVTRNVQYVGVYPDIRYPYIKAGGSNCRWEPAGTLLSNYQVTNKNLAASADILNVEQVYYNYSNNILEDWSELTGDVSDQIVVDQSDFLNSLSSSFWSISNNLFNDSNSTVLYNKGLKIFLAKNESGYCEFHSKVYYNDCSFEVYLDHEYVDVVTDSLITELRIYSSLDNGKFVYIRREFGSSVIKVTGATHLNVQGNSILTKETIYNMSRLRITKTGLSIQLSWYNKSTNAWTDLGGLIYSEFELGGVIFRLRVQKTAVFYSTNISINYVRIINDFTNTSTKTIAHSSIVSTIINDEELKCYQCKSDYLLSNGGLLVPTILSSKRAIDYIEFKYNTAVHCGGLALIDDSGVEVLGVANFTSVLVFNTMSGWILTDFIISLDTWYKFKMVFDWVGYTCTVFVENLDTYEVRTFTNSIISNKYITKIRVKSTFGGGWNSNYINFKLIDINIKTQSNSMYGWQVNNCLSGDVLNEGFDYCWGFPSTDKKPTVLLDLGAEYYINEFSLYHTPTLGDTTWLNTDYTIYSATTVSGTNQVISYSPILVIVNNTKDVVTHKLERAVLTRIIKLEIIKYNKPAVAPAYIKTIRGVEEKMIIDGGFLREFVILSTGGASKLKSSKYSVDYFNSEEHPIICMDLGARFNITGHSVNTTKGSTTDWDNNELFYQYSNDVSNDPHKVAFGELSDYSYSVAYSNTYLNTTYTNSSYTLLDSLFLNSGYYSISWYYYGSEYDNTVELSLNGEQFIPFYSMGMTSATLVWEQQSTTFNIESSGYYTMRVRNTSSTVNFQWGVKNIIIKSNNNTSKWIALRRNTATNFTWLLDTGVGVDNLKKLQVFVSGKLRPTEYYWWWVSGRSLLYYDAYNIKVGKRALKIMYPDSSVMDTVSYLPGDSFGQDKYFSIKDLLSCWLYVEDIDRLDTTIGGIVFGNFEAYSDDINRGDQAYYSWSFSTMGLRTGWNSLELPFDKASIGMPLPNNTYSKFNTSLNFKLGCTSSFGIVFKGKGLNFYMLLDGIKIKRNIFNDIVFKDEKGLCLTGKEYMEVPLSGVNLRMGTIEMWVKLYSTTEGKDHFGDHKSRTLFTIVTNNNESMSLSIRSYTWFEIGFGNTKSDYKLLYPDPTVYDVSNFFMDIDTMVHLAVTWDNEGSTIGHRDTIRLYVNNILTLSTKDTWLVEDSKSSLLRFGGGNTYLANNDDCTGSAIFNNIKYYNFCKTDFDLSNLTPSESIVNDPNNFITISQDNINFYGTTSEQLPLVYENIQPAEKIKLYYKLNKSNMNVINGLTGNIALDWQVPV